MDFSLVKYYLFIYLLCFINYKQSYLSEIVGSVLLKYSLFADIKFVENNIILGNNTIGYLSLVLLIIFQLLIVINFFYI